MTISFAKCSVMLILTVLGLGAFLTTARPQTAGFPPELFSRAERTNYQETSQHKDILEFVDTVRKLSPYVHAEEFAVSKNGKPLPLVVMANPRITTPQEAKRSGKPAIYIQANIHGDEIEGKEAVIELMREIGLGPRQRLVEQQIILFCPDFNPDGNDAFQPSTRYGHPAMLGRRASGEGFDLNRDALKLEALESKGVMKNVYLKWDPVLMVDLHRDNGSWHGYALNYAPSYLTAGHPATSQYTTQVLLPSITKTILERSGLPMFYYGGLRESRTPDTPSTFTTYSHLPRYWTNSMGLRNRIAILAEAFSYETFEKRILSSKMLVLSVLEYTNGHAPELADLIKKAEADTVSEIIANSGTMQKGVQYKAVQLEEKPIELLKRETYIDNSSGRPQTRPTGRLLIVQNVSNMNRFDPTKSSVVPRGYAFPPELKKTADKLQEQGVKVEIAAREVKCTGEEYIISKYVPGRAYQGVSMITMEGAFQKIERAIPAGWYFVDLAQPLGYLTFYLLEPETDDGLAVWGHFTDYLTAKGVDKGGVAYPILKYYTRNDRK